MGRKEPLELYGPPGTQAMAERILTAYEVDIKNRTNGPEHCNRNGYKVNAHDIKPGLVYKDQNVAVTAFAVPHGDLQAYGYRFETPDRTIVISGDTKPLWRIAMDAMCSFMRSIRKRRSTWFLQNGNNTDWPITPHRKSLVRLRRKRSQDCSF